MSTSNDMILLLHGRPERLQFVTFPHPKNSSPVVFILAGNDFYELQTARIRKHNTWFVNQRVSSDGGICLGTRFDPKFLILPFLEKAGSKFSPLDQILAQSVIDGSARIPLTSVAAWSLHLVADVKDLGDDMIFYRYNKDKAFGWLKQKVAALALLLASIRSKKESRENTAVVSSFNVSHQSKSIAEKQAGGEVDVSISHADNIVALQIITDHLSASMTSMFLEEIGVSAADLTIKVLSETKRKADWELELELEKETVAFTNSMGTKVVDNSGSGASIKSTTSIAQDAKKAKLAAAVSKPIPGVKSITSFFSKK